MNNRKARQLRRIFMNEPSRLDSKKKKRSVFETYLLEDNKALLPGGGVQWYKFRAPDYRILKTFANPGTDRYVVVFETNELGALCPLTGFPDQYRLKINYVPDKLCIESKSAKFYFGSYRDFGGFIEKIANRILDDWVKACSPLSAKIEITMNPRGGVGITVIREYERK